MDIYSKKSAWKIYLAVGGFLIVMVAMIYTFYLATKQAESERRFLEILIEAYKDIADIDNLEEDVEFAFNITSKNNDIPLIITDENDNIQYASNFPGDNQDEKFLRKQLDKIKKSGNEPIRFEGPNILYYKNSPLIRLLTYFPLIMFLLLGTFIVFGYLGFSYSRRAEQNQVWVGMSKETAHQLGTPISAILAWLEHLRNLSQNDNEKLEVLDELSKDVDRLNLIADRFSKIGSAPKLEPRNIFEELEKTKNYMQRRAPRKVSFGFQHADEPLVVNVNSHLFSWVLENLIRNALDAMEGKGLITAEVHDLDTEIEIEIADSGKGIPPSKHKTVFQPGYSTKKRGWGLGLSLAKRIIENYHKGKIFVKSSEVNQGTTFVIKLPKHEE